MREALLCSPARKSCCLADAKRPRGLAAPQGHPQRKEFQTNKLMVGSALIGSGAGESGSAYGWTSSVRRDTNYFPRSVCVLRRSTRGPEYQLQVVLADGLAKKKMLGPASYRPPGVWRREQSSRRGLIHAACRESAKSLPTMVGKEQGAGLSQNEAPQPDWRAVKPIHRLRSQARITKGGRQVRMNLLE